MNKRLRKLAYILGALAVINMTAVPAVKVQAADAVEQAAENAISKYYDAQIKRINRNDFSIIVKKKGIVIKNPRVEVKTCFYYNNNGKMSAMKMQSTAVIKDVYKTNVKAPAKIANRWTRVTIGVYVDGKLVKSINQTL